MNMSMKIACLLAVALGFGTVALRAQVQFDGTTSYTQDFDSLAFTGTTNTWTDNTTLTGWYLYQRAPTPTGSTPATYHNGDTQGAFIAYSSASDPSDIALGFHSGTVTSTLWAGLQLENTSGATIDSLTVSFTAEEWSEGTNANSPGYLLTMTHLVGSPANLESSSFPSTADLTFTAPKTSTAGSGSSTLLDGTDPANSRALTVTLTGLNWTAGSDLWLRWTSANASGTFYGFGIDDVSVVAAPEPPGLALFALGVGIAAFALRRRMARA